MTILVDANLLIYAYNAAAPQHAAARAWLDARLAASERIGIPWQSVLAFLRVVTHPRIFPTPAGTREAWTQVAKWLGSDGAWTPLPTERHAEILARLLSLRSVRGNLVHDADLAALAIEHGLMLCSTDRDFARFPGLRWQNPLAPCVG